jgi:glycosyltransferase involved in cell wall biosynthesis
VGERRFTVVTAVHNVATYLPDFIASIEAQTFPLDRFEVIAVDDGSDDESLAVLKEWQSRRPELVVVLSTENGGPGSARNAGLAHASGEWVTFADADDVLDPAYLAAVDAFIDARVAVSLVATNILLLDEVTGEVRDEHPLSHMFADADKLVDLRRYPEYFPGGVSTAFLRADVIREHGLQFDERIRPFFEDVHFAARYLLASGSPRVGYVGSARYLHRQHTVTARPGDEQNAGRHRDVPRYGYLDLLSRGSTAAAGGPPQWLQNLILYHLAGHFRTDAAITSATAARGSIAAEFVEILRAIVRYLEPAVVASFAVGRFDRVWRDILIHGLRDDRWVTPYAVVDAYDPVKELIRIAYRYVGDPPTEAIQLRGRPIKPTHAKIRSHVYFEQALLKERIAWVRSDGTLRVVLDGTPVEFRADWPGRSLTSLRPAQRERLLDGPLPPPPPEPMERRDRRVRWLARRRPVRRMFGNAWVLLDRLHNADDNAERLFRYLRKNRRDINAWFVLEKGTPDWQRLRDDGYKRVVPHGSLRWELLMLNCEQLISSHADVEVTHPPAIMKLQPEPWRFTFLQHGVIKDDLSRWLNRKSIDVFITSTPAEHESIVGDETTYVFTTREVKMTGLPRFDRLRELGAQVGADERTYILVCPTWRHWLIPPPKTGSQ